MAEVELTITPYRIIPCDIGADIIDQREQEVRNTVRDAACWRIIQQTANSLAILEAEYTASPSQLDDANRLDDRSLRMTIFKDGICVFSLVDTTERYASYEDYDPQITLNRRSEIHQAIPDHTAPYSEVINSIITSLRAILPADERRFLQRQETAIFEELIGGWPPKT